MKRKTIYLVLLLSLFLTACGNGKTAGTQTSDSTNVAEDVTASEESSSLEGTEKGELVTMPEACYEAYETTNVAALAKHPEYQWDENNLLLINPLGLTLTYTEMRDKIREMAPFIEEIGTDINHDYQYDWKYQTKQTEGQAEPMAFMEGQKSTSYSNYEDETATLQSLFYLTYKWDSRISNDPMEVEVKLSPGQQGIMTAKGIIRDSLTDTMYPEFIDAVLEEKGEVTIPESDADYPLASDRLYSYIDEELKSAGESSFQVSFDRNAQYPTAPYTTGLYPELSANVKVEDVQMEDTYRTFTSGIPTYEAIITEIGNPIDITNCIPSVSLANHGQALWDIFNKYIISGEKVIPDTASLTGQGIGDYENGSKKANYSFTVRSQGIVSDKHIIGGGATYGLNTTEDGAASVELSVYLQDIIEPNTDRNPTKADFDKGVENFCAMFKEILPELSLTAQDFQNEMTISDDEKEIDAIISIDMTVNGNTIPALISVSVSSGVGVEVSYSVHGG